MFCLDYLASAFADDQISVQRTSATPARAATPATTTTPATAATSAYGSQLLRTIASNSVDQTSMIIRTLIKATFVSLSGFRSNSVTAPAGGTPQIEPLSDFEYDPFDQIQSTIVNDELRKYGICLVLESYTFGQS